MELIADMLRFIIGELVNIKKFVIIMGFTNIMALINIMELSITIMELFIIIKDSIIKV